MVSLKIQNKSSTPARKGEPKAAMKNKLLALLAGLVTNI